MCCPARIVIGHTLRVVVLVLLVLASAGFTLYHTIPTSRPSLAAFVGTVVGVGMAFCVTVAMIAVAVRCARHAKRPAERTPVHMN